ncbi:LysR family transcriptional regulator [Amycolatopsis alkalitolerans]|uniref:LysR family transcriptional regulator n=1 Tax=Amycolatopsis alkalitolerans TaxID=2547244 RepID=UPI001359C1F6|nr:LysR family transcriptional regulator [Amycolatopsis alkalitolerans]
MAEPRADDLLYLLALARTGRLVQAGHLLGVEHTTVARRITALETAVGRRLVHRTGNRWLLTDDGEQLLAHAETIESTMHQVAEFEVSRSSSLGGTVRVAATDGIGGTVVTQALVDLQRSHPQLEIELTTATRRFDVTYKDYDVAVTLQRFQSRRFLVRHLTDYLMELYATRSYLSTHPPINDAGDLAAHTFVWYVESLLEVPELDIFEENVGTHPNLRSSNIFAQLGFVLAGGGIGLLPRFLVMDRPELVPVLPDEISVRRTLWLVVRQESLNLARVHATLDHLDARLADLQDRLIGPMPDHPG